MPENITTLLHQWKSFTITATLITAAHIGPPVSHSRGASTLCCPARGWLSCFQQQSGWWTLCLVMCLVQSSACTPDNRPSDWSAYSKTDGAAIWAERLNYLRRFALARPSVWCFNTIGPPKKQPHFPTEKVNRQFGKAEQMAKSGSVAESWTFAFGENDPAKRKIITQ